MKLMFFMIPVVCVRVMKELIVLDESDDKCDVMKFFHSRPESDPESDFMEGLGVWGDQTGVWVTC